MKLSRRWTDTHVATHYSNSILCSRYGRLWLEQADDVVEVVLEADYLHVR